MSELSELYQELILDHNRNPRNFHECQHCNSKSEGYNPLCGDRISVFLQVEENIIKDISFTGWGCAISKASASIMTSVLKGKSKDDAELLFERFHRMVTSKIGEEIDTNDLGRLAVFAGVRDYPVRVKCASLPWHTMKAALNNQEKISTE
jgi:nitrogen fixation NifU-like protein